MAESPGPSVNTPYVAPTASRGRPGVITWYRVFAVAQPLWYVVALVGWALTMPVGTGSLVTPLLDLRLHVASIAILGAFYGFAALVPYRPWGWTVGLVAIALGLATCLAPASVALLVFWLRPETKAAFCRL